MIILVIVVGPDQLPEFARLIGRATAFVKKKKQWLSDSLVQQTAGMERLHKSIEIPCDAPANVELLDSIGLGESTVSEES